MADTDPAASGRRPFLDGLRILAFSVLVVYHVGMLYVTWDFHVKSPHASAALEPWMKLSSPSRMPLLFLVSGAATAYLFMRRGASGALLRSRLSFLGVPLVFGMLVVVVPQAYVEVVAKHGYRGGFIEFLPLYYGGHRGFCDPGGGCLVLPTWNHLWFLPYLMAYTALAWLVLRRRPRALDALAAGVRGASLRGTRMLWLPVLGLLAIRIGLGQRFPETHAFFDDWLTHAQSLAFFVAGLAWARADDWPRFEALRRPALAAAAAGWIALVLPVPAPWRALGFCAMQWCAVVAAVGFAHRHLHVDGPVQRVLTEAVFPLYLLHQTVIIVGFAALQPLALPPVPEALMLVSLTVVACGIAWWLVRRVRWLRPLFGLRATSRPSPPAPPAAPTANGPPTTR